MNYFTTTGIHRTTLGQLKTPYDTFHTVRTAIPLVTQKKELFYTTGLHRTTLGQLKTPYDTFYTVRTAIPLVTQKNNYFTLQDYTELP